MTLFDEIEDPVPPSARHVVTTVYGDSDDLIREVVRLYPLDGLTVADVTYGKGVFWKQVDLSRFTLLGTDGDLKPSLLAQGSFWPPVLRQENFCALPYADASVDVVAFDPDFIHHPGKALAMNKQYNNHAAGGGMYHRDILRDKYCRGMIEAWRVLRPGGMLWVKGKDEIESSKQCWSHREIPTAAARLGFTDVEQFLLVASGAQLPHRGRRQHADKNHSFLWIFRRPPTAPRATRGRPKKGRVVTTNKQQRGRSYQVARLLRDHPDVYACYMANELPSVHAAAVAAGLVKPRGRTPRGR